MLAQQRDRLGLKQLVDHHLRQRPLRLPLGIAHTHARHVGVVERKLIREPFKRPGLPVQPPLARLAQQRPHATDELAVARVCELACKFTRAQMHQEIDRVLAAQRTRLIAPVLAQP